MEKRSVKPFILHEAPGIAFQRAYTQAGYPEQMRMERWIASTTRSRHTQNDVPAGLEFRIR